MFRVVVLRRNPHKCIQRPLLSLFSDQTTFLSVRFSCRLESVGGSSMDTSAWCWCGVGFLSPHFCLCVHIIDNSYGCDLQKARALKLPVPRLNPTEEHSGTGWGGVAGSKGVALAH